MTDILAATLRLVLVGLVAYKIVRWGYMLNPVERMGLGIIGGSGFLTIPVIMDHGGDGTPFDIWAGVLFSLGVIMYLGGRISRHVRHEHRNDMAKDQAVAHLVSRGKI